MWVSTREACAILAGRGISRGQALRILTAGFAGEPIRTRAAVLHDEDQVRALVARPTLSWPDAFDLCPDGVFVSRRPLSEVTRPREAQLAGLGSGWEAISPWTWMTMGFQLRGRGSLPLIATVSGLVALGAEIVGLRGGSELVLEPPGPWFDAVEGCWFPTRAGRSWILHLAPPAPLASALTGT